MFLDNKYKCWYYKIIEKASNQNRRKGNGIYFENHHIIPKSLGGRRTKTNMVYLTAREHYVCHLLLVRFTSGEAHYKMRGAVYYLQRRHIALSYNVFTSRQYAAHRTIVGTYMLGRNHTDEARAKMSASHKGKRTGSNNPMYGKVVSEETRRKIADAQRGEKNHAYGIGCLMPNGERFAGENHGMWGKTHSKETRAKIRAAVKGTQDGEKNHRFGIKLTDEEKDQRRKNMKGRKWIKHIETNQNIMVWPDEVQSYIDKGWKHGRILKRGER